jgi:hypothetical protein
MIGESGERSVEHLDVLRRRALLRPVRGGRPAWAEQGVRDVTGDPQVDAAEAWIEPVELDTRRVDRGTERLEEPGATVGRRAPPDPERDRGDPRIEDREEHLAGSPRRGADRIPLRGREPGQAARLGELDDRMRPVRGTKPPRGDPPANRIRGRDGLPLPAPGGGDRDERSLAAIRQRSQEHVVVGSGVPPARGERGRDLDGGQ